MRSCSCATRYRAAPHPGSLRRHRASWNDHTPRRATRRLPRVASPTARLVSRPRVGHGEYLRYNLVLTVGSAQDLVEPAQYLLQIIVTKMFQAITNLKSDSIRGGFGSSCRLPEFAHDRDNPLGFVVVHIIVKMSQESASYTRFRSIVVRSQITHESFQLSKSIACTR